MVYVCLCPSYFFSECSFWCIDTICFIHVVAMSVFGALDQVYRILGKPCIGAIESNDFVMQGVDYSHSGDMVTG